MKTLIIKLNATGDVVRTTTLLRILEGSVTWITASNNRVLLDGLAPSLRCLTWDQRDLSRDGEYDLVINLEDEPEIAAFASSVACRGRFGAISNADGAMAYTEDSHDWFDLSLISRFGREQADKLKLHNRRTYQDLVFAGLGRRFQGEQYLLPAPPKTDLVGDIAVASAAGPVWPMKNWAHYDQLKRKLEAEGLRVNELPKRPSLLEHLGDVAGHRCLVGGDSLPMHLALGVGVPCVSLFTCTSPWEIHDYGIQTKLISPLLERFFYKRGYDPVATTAISLDEVYHAVMKRL